MSIIITTETLSSLIYSYLVKEDSKREDQYIMWYDDIIRHFNKFDKRTIDGAIDFLIRTDLIIYGSHNFADLETFRKSEPPRLKFYITLR